MHLATVLVKASGFYKPLYLCNKKIIADLAEIFAVSMRQFL
jgi:hypothetical protein